MSHLLPPRRCSTLLTPANSKMSGLPTNLILKQYKPILLRIPGCPTHIESATARVKVIEAAVFNALVVRQSRVSQLGIVHHRAQPKCLGCDERLVVVEDLAVGPEYRIVPPRGRSRIRLASASAVWERSAASTTGAVGYRSINLCSHSGNGSPLFFVPVASFGAGMDRTGCCSFCEEAREDDIAWARG
jgi:hypothetical protein